MSLFNAPLSRRQVQVVNSPTLHGDLKQICPSGVEACPDAFALAHPSSVGL